MHVTLLSGFLGAGKTTLLKRILRLNNERSDAEKLKIAVIVNDMGEINLDANEIKDSKLIQEDAEMVEMHNGCICCTLRGDLLRTVKVLSEEGNYDCLVIESTGISEPLPVAQTFVMDVDREENDPYGLKKLAVATSDLKSLSNFATLDTLVTVVDALNIFDVLSSLETLADKNNIAGMLGNTGAKNDENNQMFCFEDSEKGEAEADEDIDDRSIAQLMLDQIEFANVIIISKAAIFLQKESEEKLREIEALLRRLNPKARVLVPRADHYGDLDVAHEVLRTGLFDMEDASQSAGWLLELEREEHTPETEEYGISSTVFRAREMPFHPERLAALLSGFGHYKSVLEFGASAPTAAGSKAGAGAGGRAGSKAGGGGSGEAEEEEEEKQLFLGVVRSKGRLWLANAHAVPIDFHTAGRHLSIDVHPAPFVHSLDRGLWQAREETIHQEMVARGKWHEKWGDHESELVFIGVHLDKAAIHEQLTAALLTEEESEVLGGLEGWKTLEDPFFNGQCAEHLFELPDYEFETQEDDEDVGWDDLPAAPSPSDSGDEDG